MVSRTGQTHAGKPLSLNRRPAEDLAPWVARMVAVRIDAPPDYRLTCGTLNDVPFIRCLIGGEWTAHLPGGPQGFPGRALLFGPQSRYMAISGLGPIHMAGCALRPGALHRLFGQSATLSLDHVLPSEVLGLPQASLADPCLPEARPEEWLEALEEVIRQHIARVGARPPDPVSGAFDLAAFADPCLKLTDYADQAGISLKRLERIVKRDFGLTPKQVLRRARVLDLAAQLCGVSDQREEAELLLRYADQSHLIKEFGAFFGMTPSQFRTLPKPFLTLNLEVRQARRLEELDRLKPGDQRPWRAD